MKNYEKILEELNSVDAKTWSPNFPQQIGSYWCYGWLWSAERHAEKDDPELNLVEIHQASNSLVYITHGTFLYQEEGGWGLWQKVELPQKPKPEILKELYRAFNNNKQKE
jgi:hypothetical protein